MKISDFIKLIAELILEILKSTFLIQPPYLCVNKWNHLKRKIKKKHINNWKTEDNIDF